MSEAKSIFDELFPYGIDFDGDESGAVMINRCDALNGKQITYIENATFEYDRLTKQNAEMYELILDLSDRDECQSLKPEINAVLAKARGES